MLRASERRASWSAAAAGAALEGVPVDLDDRHHLADRRGRERLLGAEQVGEREDALRDR